MTTLPHFCKADNTPRTTTSTVNWVEVAEYTISWSDLTGAGFENADNVAIIIGVKIYNSGANNNSQIYCAKGSSFATATTSYDGAYERSEPVGTDAGDQILFVTKQTLATNDNLYVGFRTTAGTAYLNEFFCLVLNLDDLSTNDWIFATAAGSGGNGPTSYDNNGANATIPATGDWLLIGSVQFSVDSATTDMLAAIHDGTADISEVRTQAEDGADVRSVGTMAYKANLAATTTVRVRYAAPSGDHDVATNNIFGLRLNAFADHFGAHTTNTITHTVVDTYQEFAGAGAYSLGNTGPFVVLGWPIHSIAETAKRPYGRIQIDGSDWPAANANRAPVADNGATPCKIAPLLASYAASQSAGTLDIDLDCAEDADITPNPTCIEQVAVGFSLVLAPATTTITLSFGVISTASNNPTIRSSALITSGAAQVASQNLSIVRNIVLETAGVSVAGSNVTPLYPSAITLDSGSIAAPATSSLLASLSVPIDVGAAAVVGVDLAADAAVGLDVGAAALAASDLTFSLNLQIDDGAASMTSRDVTPLPAGSVLLDDGAVVAASAVLIVLGSVPIDTAAANAAGASLDLALNLPLAAASAAVVGTSLTILTAATVVLDSGSVLAEGADVLPGLPSSETLDTGAAGISGAEIDVAGSVALASAAVLATGANLTIVGPGAPGAFGRGQRFTVTFSTGKAFECRIVTRTQAA